MIPYFVVFVDWGFLALRLVVGAILLAHGWPKLKDLKANGINFTAMGFKPGAFWGTIAALIEVLGGAMIATGFFTKPAAFFIAIEFIVILAWRCKNKHKFVGGWELDAIMFASAVLIFLNGAGAFSLSEYLQSWLLR